MKNFFLTIFLIVVFIGCKNDNKSKKVEEILIDKQEIKSTFDNNILVYLDVIVPNDDVFELKYTVADNKSFSPKEKVSSNIVGSSDNQLVEFILPENILPTNLRLKIGENNTEGIIINSIKFSLGDSSFLISKDRFFQFFIPNKFIEYNRKDYSFISKKINDDFRPSFVSRSLLIERLEQKIY